MQSAGNQPWLLAIPLPFFKKVSLEPNIFETGKCWLHLLLSLMRVVVEQKLNE
jgi:hypothetical protein